MSNIGERFKEMKENKEYQEFLDASKKTVTARFDGFQMFCLDVLVEEVGSNRAAVIGEIASEGVFEGLKAIGLSLDDLQAKFISEKSGRSLKECKAELAKTGIKNLEVANV